MVEVALALGIATFCLLVLFALIPQGLSSKRETLHNTIAAGLASEVLSDIRNVPPGTTMTPRFQLTIPAVGGLDSIASSPRSIYFAQNGAWKDTLVAAGPDASVYRVTIGFKPPATGAVRTTGATAVRILVNWPAAAYPSPDWPQHQSDSFELSSWLDRN